MLEIKNVKTFQGVEGYGYNLTLYLNGKRVAFVIDEGCGGTPHYQWEGKERAEKNANEQAVNAYIDTLPPEKCPDDAEDWEKTLYDENGYRKLDIDDVISKKVDDYETAKQLQRQKKKYVLFTVPGMKPDTYYKTEHKGDIEGAKAAVLKRHPEATFL